MGKQRIPLALLVFAVWLGIMFWGAWNPHDPTRTVDTITGGVSRQILSAGIFLLIVVIAMRWWDMGFNAPHPLNSLRVVVFPAVYLVLFTIGTLLVGWPAPSVVFFLALNCLLVGFSEELMFRGVLFRAFRSGMSLWPTIWLTSAIFGFVHVFNAFTTGDIFGALIQACTAFMAGTFFLAVVLRTGSVLPSMLFHAAWDFLLTTMAAGSPVLVSAPSAPSLVTVLLPFALETPLFVYSIFVLRKIARATRPLSIGDAKSAESAATHVGEGKGRKSFHRHLPMDQSPCRVALPLKLSFEIHVAVVFAFHHAWPDPQEPCDGCTDVPIFRRWWLRQ